ncbi:MAG TPA: hypothetical protein VLT36_19585 [Candidatus Dormibacteraeota bacterium]|nr:hypothetical protein [Candidatus Dormibacteraeota bacterium]
MERKLTIEDARQSLTAHAAEKGLQAFEKYGPNLGWNELKQLLQDPSLVRYPCEVIFDSNGLLPGELAHPFPQGDTPEDGFKLHIQPRFLSRLDQVPAIVLYQLVLVNYGEFAAAEDAEAFGAAALGLTKEQYYEMLCGLADRCGKEGDGGSSAA